MRPGTPDWKLDCHIIADSASASEGQSSSLGQDAAHEGFRQWVAADLVPGEAGRRRDSSQAGDSTCSQLTDFVEAGTPPSGSLAGQEELASVAEAEDASSHLPAWGFPIAQGQPPAMQQDSMPGQAREPSAAGDEFGKGYLLALRPADGNSRRPSFHQEESSDAQQGLGEALPASNEPEEHFSLSRQRSENGLHCDTCNMSATSQEQLVSHLEGKKHKRFVAMAELRGEESARLAEGALSSHAEADLHCDLCDVTAPSAHHREYHLRGQKHQRREKQHQLMEASAELATNSVNALLAENQDSGDTDVAVAVCLDDTGGFFVHEGKPLRSPFEEFETAPVGQPVAAPPALQMRLSSKIVRFGSALESFSEEPSDEGGGQILNAPPSLTNAISTGSFKLISGGSYSSPAAHFCPVCGIIATSEANLQDHLSGRRHARRLQYLSHMPEEEQRDQLQRTMTAGSGVFRQGSLVLPSSMDLTAYIGRIAQVHPQAPVAAKDGPTALETEHSLSSQHLGDGSADSQFMDPSSSPPEATAEAVKAGAALESESGEAPAEADWSPKPQPRCEICGITTTSQAHMEAHMAGRKHRRRVEAAAGRVVAQQSPHYCALCDISTTSVAHLSLHLVGRAHRRRQKAIEDGEFPFPLSQTVALAAAEQRANSEPIETGRRRSEDVSSCAEEVLPGGIPSNSSSSQNTPARRWERERRSPGSGYRPGLQDPSRAGSAELATQRQAAYHWQHQMGARQGGGRGNPSPLPQPLPYPVGMLPYSPYFPPASIPQFVQATGPAPVYGWWPPQPHPVAANHRLPKGPFPQSMQYPQHFQQPPPYAVAMSQAQAGTYGLSPFQHQHNPRAGLEPNLAASTWPQQEVYNCEVCNVRTDKIDDLKQHLRGKQHMRRLHNSSERKD